jgi:VWFA-related protein
MRAGLTAGALVAALAQAFAQPSFRAGVDLVTVPITVRHKDADRDVPAVTAAGLRVSENGVEQRIDFVERDVRPLSLTIVLDASSSMVGLSRTWAEEAMHGVFSRLLPADQVSLIVFGSWSITAVSWSRASAIDGLGWAQWVMPPDTALIDAVQAALESMDTAANDRGVVLVLSDGLEIASSLTISDVVQTRRQSETAVYAFEFDPAWDQEGHWQLPRRLRQATAWQRHTNYMEQLVGDSGGAVHGISARDAVAASTAALMSDLRSQYVLGYTSTRPMDGKYRRIKVEPKDKDLRLRHRGGYLAMPR